MQSWFTIEFNEDTWRLEKVAVDISLLDALMQQAVIDPAVRVNSDQGGVLMVMLDGDQNRRPVFRAFDSSTVPLVVLAGRRVWSIEGLKESFPDHPLWKVEGNYTGYDIHPVRRNNLLALLFEWCSTPGKNRKPQLPQGYISRTADYSSAHKMASDLRDEEFEASKFFGDRNEGLEELQYVDEGGNRFYRPRTIVELFDWSRRAVNVQVLAGAHSVRAEIGGGDDSSATRTLLSVEAVEELRMIENEGSQWEIGSAVPLSQVASVIELEFPGLGKILQRFASSPVRNRVTLGGQLNCPSGRQELGPILLALDARVQLVSEEGSRDLTLDSFFGSGRDMSLRQNEIIKGVSLPRNTPEMLQARGCKVRLSDAYKVSGRRTLCPPVLTSAFSIDLDDRGIITRACMVYGQISDRPLAAIRTAAALQGKSWNQDTVADALRALDEEVASLGGLEQEDLRRPLVGSLFEKFFHQHPRAQNVLPRCLGVIEERRAG